MANYEGRLRGLEERREEETIPADLADRILRASYGCWLHDMRWGPPERRVHDKWINNPELDEALVEYMIKYGLEHGEIDASLPQNEEASV